VFAVIDAPPPIAVAELESALRESVEIRVSYNRIRVIELGLADDLSALVEFTVVLRCPTSCYYNYLTIRESLAGAVPTSEACYGYSTQIDFVGRDQNVKSMKLSSDGTCGYFNGRYFRLDGELDSLFRRVPLAKW